MNLLKIILSILAIVFVSCEEDQRIFEGPSLQDLFGELTIIKDLKVVGDSANFSNGETLSFTASFSYFVDWKITITGQSSNAIKIIYDKSNTISPSNSSWGGEATTLPFFQNEDCSVVLSFTGHEDSLFSAVNIEGTKTYGNGKEVLISDFEGFFNPNFGSFFNSGMIKTVVEGGAGQKNRFLKQESAELGCSWDWLIGYVDYFSNHWFESRPLSADPNSIYFNIMINGDSTLSPTNEPNSLFRIEFWEDEDQNNYFNNSTEDMLYAEFLVDWSGWKMISLKYSELLLAPPSGVGAGGNQIREPNKVSNVRTLLLADPYDQNDPNTCSGFAKADVDYLIWSEGSPILEQ